jgi:segregation and condensation protein B
MTLTMDAPEQLHLDGVAPGNDLSIAELAALVEALLLVAQTAPTVDDLADVAGVPAARIEAALAEIAGHPGRGWIIQRQGSSLHLASAPRFAPYIREFLGLEREGRLSPAALETLAIIAYQQPVTRAEIEAVRGVDASGVLATLHARELIEPVSRLAAVGNPFQYGTTVSFLKLFGLSSLADLPPLGEFAGEDGITLLAQAMEPTPDATDSPGDTGEDAPE